MPNVGIPPTLFEGPSKSDQMSAFRQVEQDQQETQLTSVALLLNSMNRQLIAVCIQTRCADTQLKRSAAQPDPLPCLGALASPRIYRRMGTPAFDTSVREVSRSGPQRVPRIVQSHRSFLRPSSPHRLIGIGITRTDVIDCRGDEMIKALEKAMSPSWSKASRCSAQTYLDHQGKQIQNMEDTYTGIHWRSF